MQHDSVRFSNRLQPGNSYILFASNLFCAASWNRVLGDPGGSEAFHEKVVKGVSLRDENTVGEFHRLYKTGGGGDGHGHVNVIT